MRLAWSNTQLEGRCVARATLRALAGDQADAAEDLISIVARAPRLEAIVTFRSVRIGSVAGSLTLSIEEIDMHTRPLSSDGQPQHVEDLTVLNDLGMSQALLVEDLRVRGKSVLRLAS